ncbi:MAG: hypothetical protein ACYS1A_20205 [Planctomycetota bacterium]|jgi:hypothetical protein
MKKKTKNNIKIIGERFNNAIELARKAFIALAKAASYPKKETK